MLVKSTILAPIMTCLLLFQSEPQIQDVSANGLWSIEKIGYLTAESTEFTPVKDPRIVLILEERFLDIQAIESDHPYAYTLTILARERHQGRDFCLIEYPKDLSIKRGKMIINSERTNQSLLFVDFEGHDDSGKKCTVRYCLARPTSIDASRYFRKLAASGVYARELPYDSPTSAMTNP